MEAPARIAPGIQNFVIGPKRHIYDSRHHHHASLIHAILSIHNAEDHVRGCLESLLTQTTAYQLEAIVIDNGL